MTTAPARPTKIKGRASLPEPWEPVEVDKADISAIKAVYAGTADEHQQRRLVDWLMRATGINEMEFRPGPDGERATAFAGGKRFVGQQFFTLAKAVLSASSSNAAP